MEKASELARVGEIFFRPSFCVKFSLLSRPFFLLLALCLPNWPPFGAAPLKCLFCLLGEHLKEPILHPFVPLGRRAQLQLASQQNGWRCFLQALAPITCCAPPKQQTNSFSIARAQVSRSSKAPKIQSSDETQLRDTLSNLRDTTVQRGEETKRKKIDGG